MATRIFTLTVEVETVEGKTPPVDEMVTMLESELDTTLDTDSGGMVEVTVVAVNFDKTKKALRQATANVMGGDMTGPRKS